MRTNILHSRKGAVLELVIVTMLVVVLLGTVLTTVTLATFRRQNAVREAFSLRIAAESLAEDLLYARRTGGEFSEASAALCDPSLSCVLTEVAGGELLVIYGPDGGHLLSVEIAEDDAGEWQIVRWCYAEEEES